MVLLVTEPVGAPSLAGWLSRPARRGGLGCHDALNLDGGPSTQASLRAGDTRLEVLGGWPVPTGLVVVPRAEVADGGARGDRERVRGGRRRVAARRGPVLDQRSRGRGFRALGAPASSR